MAASNHTALFSAADVMRILAQHVIAVRGIEPADPSHIEGELMAVAEKDAQGNVAINQYRLTIKVEEESWRG